MSKISIFLFIFAFNILHAQEYKILDKQGWDVEIDEEEYASLVEEQSKIDASMALNEKPQITDISFEKLEVVEDAQGKKKAKGILYITWGYNWSWYGNSDLRIQDLENNEYDVLFKDVPATDRPTKFGKVYITDPTIPQYQFRFGYLWNGKHLNKDNKLQRLVGVEAHMMHYKYVVAEEESVEVFGYFKGREYDGEVIPIKHIGTFEHTDGFNQLEIVGVAEQEMVRTKKGRFIISAQLKLGGGLVIPRTAVSLKDNAFDPNSNSTSLNNKFHLAGYGGSAELSLKVRFFEYVFLQAGIHLSRYNITNAFVIGEGTKLSQKINTMGIPVSFGLSFPIGSMIKRRQ